MMRYSSKWLFFGLSIIIISCSTTKTTQIPIKAKQNSSIDSSFTKSQKIAVLTDTSSFIYVVGKAKILYRDATENERLSVDFESTPTKTLMKFKNSLGIEGVHLLIEGDSITEYNRIDKTVFKTSKVAYGMNYSRGYTPIPLMDLFFPSRLMFGAEDLEESEEVYSLTHEPKLLKATIDKTSLVYRTIESIADISDFKQISFDEYATIDGHDVPRKMNLVGTEFNPYRIQVMVTELRVFQQAKQIEIDFPSSITIERAGYRYE